jgi:hydroxymethylbilane synthase
MRRLELRGLQPLRRSSIVIGSRGSQLALWQAQWVQYTLLRHHPDLEVTITVIKTLGDKIQDVPLAKVGGKGLFIKEIESALISDEIDLAVHSLKDMPAELPHQLCIGAISKREDPRDVLVSASGLDLEKLPAKARIGTSSLRRQAQLLHARQDLDITPLRGNLDTRLKKLRSEHLDAIVLAAAGVHRMEMRDRISAYLSPELMLPAVGQGALCLEHRRDDDRIAALIAPINHRPSQIAARAERAFLQHLEGGCQVPIAAYARIEDEQLHLEGLVATVDGCRVIRDGLTGLTNEAQTLGHALAGRLLEQGAEEILANLQTEADHP